MSGPTGADQPRPGQVDDWDKVLADQAALYAERARRRRRPEDIDPQTAAQIAQIIESRREPPDPPPTPGR